MVAGAVPEEEHNIMIDGENVEQVDRFKYLGSTKTANANCSNDIKSRIAIAKKRMIDLQVIWNDTNLSIQLKMKLVKTLVWSALVYGAESWTLFKADRIMAARIVVLEAYAQHKLDAEKNKCQCFARAWNRETTTGKGHKPQNGILWPYCQRKWKPLSP